MRRAPFKNLNTTRRIGIRVCGPFGLPVLLALTLLIAVGPAAAAQALGAEAKVVFAIAVISYGPGMFAPALFGWRHLRQVEREAGKAVREELMARFARVRPGEPVPFTLQQIIDDVREAEHKEAPARTTDGAARG